MKMIDNVFNIFIVCQKNDHIILIVSGRLGQIIVPKIAQLQQIILIYVYCQDKKANEQWGKQFSKVKDVIFRLDDLFHHIQAGRTQIKHHKFDEELPFCAFNSNILNEGQSLTELNGQFIHFQLLIDCLIRMKPSLNEKQEFITYLKEKFEKNSDELKIVEEFEHHYSPVQSIKCLKLKITDSFTSNNSCNDYKKVRFTIDADPRLENTKAFNNITSLSYYKHEEEILFMIGSIFQIMEMKRDDSGLWNILLRLCSNNDKNLQSLFEYMKQKLGNEETNLYIFADVLRDMGKLSYTEKYYCCYLDQLSANHPHIAACYHALGIVTNHRDVAMCLNNMGNTYQDEKQHLKALECHKKALTIRQNHFPEHHSDIDVSHNNLGNIYVCLDQHDLALQHYTSSIKIYEKSLPLFHIRFGMTYENMGLIYEHLDDFEKALSNFKKASEIYRRSLPHTDSNVIRIK
ncbi:unnamed protein product [Rotaria sp. Silwood1]|nr:unnamed protein product [Rotaria sp. Silwood1]CAF1181293.1 unnamed protein product [Rotaria sp. Silwood1]CAF3435985.1 unnamed protein product [Rotaria sp. Silwood1]CAF3457010.1 unnamed protein product [Rotaria sp. Silwood1]